MRLVHAAPDHFMKPGMRWIASLLKQHLAQYTHILKDTDHLFGALPPNPILLIKAPVLMVIQTFAKGFSPPEATGSPNACKASQPHDRKYSQSFNNPLAWAYFLSNRIRKSSA